MTTSVALIPELVLIPGGSFVMGSEAGRTDERPSHSVSLGTFRAGVRPVSNLEYLAFTEATGYQRPPFVDEPRFAAPDQPVVGVSWHDALAYCGWLAGWTGVGFRLPTEAEREFAALGGLEGIGWPWGDQAPETRATLAEIATLDRPHVPRAICANGYGLLCMADNVHEWCSDWYARSYYALAELEAPTGPVRGTRRASRGGSWRHQIKFTRLSARSSLDPSFRYNDYGFRVYADGH